ncbi:MAG: hypothetical protein ACOC2L_01640 [Candidatus Sumerlaeota bacterium]
MPEAETSSEKSSPPKLIVPANLPESVDSVFRKAFHESQFAKGFQKILAKMDTTEQTPIELTEAFLQSYERQVKKLKPHEVDAAPNAFRAGCAWQMLQTLPRFRMEFAEKGYNFLFLEIYLKKRVLAEIQGLTVRDIQRRIIEDGHRPKIYLDDRLHELVPQTFLKTLK